MQHKCFAQMGHLERSALAMSLHLLIKARAESNRCDRSEVVETCHFPNESLLKIMELPQKASKSIAYTIFIQR